MSVTQILNKINAAILNPLIILLFAIASLVFVWGIFKFIWKNSDDTEREQGKRAMLWGIVGMFIMVAAFAIIRFILSNIGITDPAYPFNNPT